MDLDKEYDLALTRVSKLEDRRQTVATTYLTVNTLISGTIAFLVKDAHLTEFASKLATAGFLVTGFVATFLWRAVLNQLSLLISHWYRSIRELEKKIPNSSLLVTDEYDAYYVPPKNKSFTLTGHERRLSWLFTTIYAAFLLADIFGFLNKK